jgi:hypothetical protein
LWRQKAGKLAAAVPFFLFVVLRPALTRCFDWLLLLLCCWAWEAVVWGLLTPFLHCASPWPCCLLLRCYTICVYAVWWLCRAQRFSYIFYCYLLFIIRFSAFPESPSWSRANFLFVCLPVFFFWMERMIDRGTDGTNNAPIKLVGPLGLTSSYGLDASKFIFFRFFRPATVFWLPN